MQNFLYQVKYFYDNGIEVVAEKRFVACAYPLTKDMVENSIRKKYKKKNEEVYDFQVSPVVFLDNPVVL